MLDMAGPLMVLALPLIDVTLSVGRRIVRGVPIFSGDRGHIHHMILARGFKPRNAALILYSVCFLAAFFALLQSFSRAQFRAPIIGVFCSLIWIGVNYLGYVEFGALRKTLSRKSVLRLLQEEIYLHELRRRLDDADTVEACWLVVRAVCKDLSFCTAQMYLQDQSFDSTFNANTTNPSWKLTLALGRKGHLILTRSSDDRPPKLMMSTLTLIQESIQEKDFDFAVQPISNPSTHMASGAA
jgi:UDP-GlcNAc:undecaprenyl-phosphate GlcNAc-1-phosphate transferase